VSLRADFLVIGGGIAGLRAAIDLVEHGHVLLLTKASGTESNTGYAQGGVAAAIGPDDSPALHLADTLEAGAGLCDSDAVEVLVNEGPRYVRELIAWGAAFDRDEDGRPALGTVKARTACGACSTRVTRRAARSPARSGPACRATDRCRCSTTRSPLA
jgi:Aspartate oxidase